MVYCICDGTRNTLSMIDPRLNRTQSVNIADGLCSVLGDSSRLFGENNPILQNI